MQAQVEALYRESILQYRDHWAMLAWLSMEPIQYCLYLAITSYPWSHYVPFKPLQLILSTTYYPLEPLLSTLRATKAFIEPQQLNLGATTSHF
jgi:hypothetical protein